LGVKVEGSYAGEKGRDMGDKDEGEDRSDECMGRREGNIQERYKIEQVIGLIKNSYKDMCMKRRKDMAKKMITIRVILWNMAVFVDYRFYWF
jgi:hypothetical protein